MSSAKKNMETNRDKSTYIQNDTANYLSSLRTVKLWLFSCIKSAFVPLFYNVDQLIMCLVPH